MMTRAGHQNDTRSSLDVLKPKHKLLGDALIVTLTSSYILDKLL